MHHDGNGVPADRAKSWRLWKESCERGYQRACNDYAVGITDGEVAGDLAHAAALHRGACHSGETLACENLAHLFAQGRGVDKDEACATQLYKIACTAGRSRACNNYSFFAERTEPEAALAALRTVQDRCSRGFADACFNAALMLKRQGADPKLVSANFSRACELDLPAGCNNLGYRYVHGEGVEKDAARGFKLFERACVKAYPNGCDSLGQAYEKGFGTERDVEKAKESYTKACEWGLTKACGKIN